MQVAVIGGLSKTGTIEKAQMRVLQAPYVAGVSEVVLTGLVKTINLETGHVVVGNQTVDFNALSDTRAGTMRVGNLVTVRGTMPQADQTIVSTVIAIHLQ